MTQDAMADGLPMQQTSAQTVIEKAFMMKKEGQLDQR